MTNHEMEVKRLNDAVDEFSKLMKLKLAHKASQGWEGWNDPNSLVDIKAALLKHSARVFAGEKGQAVDVANFAMMVSYLESMT